ncbi:MAG: enoyl-CoA hydratase/isomerase family protein [Deltaproteobacteria bacterium]|nr:MAG: enoyl-CoA hydratase/isomerase family protein [Deltaproteobacteria bacterium]
MGYLELTVHDKERVGVLTMTHGEENRFHPDFMAAFLAQLDALEADDRVKALVVTGGHPKFFSNGLDLEYLMPRIGDPAALDAYMRQVNGLLSRVCLYPKPMVAALNGHTFAGGFFLAAHMDFRFMREDRGWVCLPEVDINIPLLPGMLAICQAVLPPASLHRIYYTGQRFTGPEAVAMGFVEAAYPGDELLPRTVAFAAELARKRTRTYAEMKRRLRADVARILAEEDPKHFLDTLRFATS